MKKTIISLLTVMLFLLMIGIGAHAEISTSNEEMVSIPKSKLTEQQKSDVQKEAIAGTVKNVGEWVGLGKEIGSAVDGSLGALTTRANEFSNTRVGVFTMVLVAYKVIGTDLIQLLVGFLVALIFIPLFTLSYYKYCTPKRVVQDTNTSKSGEVLTRYETLNEDAYGSERWSYFIVFIVFVIGECVIIFV